MYLNFYSKKKNNNNNESKILKNTLYNDTHELSKKK